MGRSGSCPSCSAKVANDAAYCPSCGQALGVDLDLAAFDEDDELGDPAEGVRPERPPRWRNLVLAAVVAAVLVGGAVLISRDDSDPAAVPDAAADTTTTTSRPRRSPPTTRATIAPPSTVAYLELPPKGQMLPEPTATVLYGSMVGNQIARVELDTGRVSLRRLPRSEAEPRQLIPRAGALVVASFVGTDSYALPLDLQGEAVELEGSGEFQVFQGPEADELWEVESAFGPDQASTTARRIKLDGSVVGPELELPLTVTRGDGGGLLLGFGAGGGYYVFDPDGRPSRLTESERAAVGAGTIVDVTCDASLSCRWRVTDRATGAQRLLDVPPPPELVFGWYGSGTVSPDGRWLASVDPAGGLDLLDLNTGALLETGGRVDYFGDQPVTWSVDGRWLFWVRGGTIWAWQPGSDEPVRAGGSLESFTGLVAVAA